MTTGAGKTTVMIIAWQTINALRHPQSRRFTRGFLIVTPGITIKDRLRVLTPATPTATTPGGNSGSPGYAHCREKAKIVITTPSAPSGTTHNAGIIGQLKNITRDWLEQCLVCTGGAYPAQLGACRFSVMLRPLLSPRHATYIEKNTLNVSRTLSGVYQELADMACERIVHAVTQSFIGERPVKALFDPYNPSGSSIHVNFTTSKASRWQTDSRKCHINWVVLDSDWEAEFCRVAESHRQVIACVKNQGLGFEVPYRHGSQNHVYLPDFIVLIDDDRGPAAPPVPHRGNQRHPSGQASTAWAHTDAVPSWNSATPSPWKRRLGSG